MKTFYEEYKDKDEFVQLGAQIPWKHNSDSEVFDRVLSIVFIEDDVKRKIFHKLSDYCREFNKELANDYDEILEEDLSDIEEE